MKTLTKLYESEGEKLDHIVEQCKNELQKGVLPKNVRKSLINKGTSEALADKILKLAEFAAKNNKLTEGKYFNVDKKYTHFCVENATGKIVDGWDYKGTDDDSIKEYYKMDMKDNDRSLKDYKLITKTKLIKDGIDPFNWDSWKK